MDTLERDLVNAQAMVAYPPLKHQAVFDEYDGFRVWITGGCATAEGPQPYTVWDPRVDPPRPWLEVEADCPDVDGVRLAGMEDTWKLLEANWQENRRNLAPRPGQVGLFEGYEDAEVAVIIGCGPSLRGKGDLLSAARRAGAVLIGMNAADVHCLEIFDYLVCHTPRARGEWFGNPLLAGTRRFLGVGVAPCAAEGAAEGVYWFNIVQPGTKFYREALACDLPVLGGCPTVIGYAYWLAARLPKVKRIAMVGCDLSWKPGGRYYVGGSGDPYPVGRLMPDCRGETVKTLDSYWRSLLDITAMAGFMREHDVATYNAGDGLPGCITVTSKSRGEFKPIEVKPLEEIL